MKVDAIVLTLDDRTVSPRLIESIKAQENIGQVFLIDSRPLSKARVDGGLQASTKYVAMFDDDVSIPKDWLSKVLSNLEPNVGAVATVAVQSNRHVAAYEKVVKTLVGLHKVDTNPFINNILIKRQLLITHNPPPLFFGEDHLLRKHVEDSGYVWKVIPSIGAVHLGTPINHFQLGMSYNRYGHYSLYQILRRFISRLLFIPYSALANASLTTLTYLTRTNVEFLAGWLRETVNRVEANNDV